MYAITRSDCDSLTEKAAYPSCRLNWPLPSFRILSQREELALLARTRSDNALLGVNRNQDVDVMLDGIDFDNFVFFPANDARGITMQLLANAVGNQRCAVLGESRRRPDGPDGAFDPRGPFP